VGPKLFDSRGQEFSIGHLSHPSSEIRQPFDGPERADVTKERMFIVSKAINHVVFPVKDLARSTKLFAKLLGTEPYADSPYYVGFRVEGQEVGLDPNGHKKGVGGPLPFWEVADIRATVEELVGDGASIIEGVRDVGGGKLVASLKDWDGNPIGLTQSP